MTQYLQNRLWGTSKSPHWGCEQPLQDSNPSNSTYKIHTDNCLTSVGSKSDWWLWTRQVVERHLKCGCLIVTCYWTFNDLQPMRLRFSRTRKQSQLGGHRLRVDCTRLCSSVNLNRNQSKQDVKTLWASSVPSVWSYAQKFVMLMTQTHEIHWLMLYTLHFSKSEIYVFGLLTLQCPDTLSNQHTKDKRDPPIGIS